MSADPHPFSRDALISRYGERYKWLVMLVTAIGTIAAILPTTSFNVAAPALMLHFQVSHGEVQLVVTAFMVANTIAMLPAPWLIQRFGLRRCFLIAIVLLTVTSVLGSISPDFRFLVVTRALQGAVAGVLIPMGTIVVMRLFTIGNQGRASGILGFSVILAPAIAPSFGGILIDHLSWRAVALMPLPFCAIAWLGGRRFLPLAGEREHQTFDWLGMGLLSLLTLAWLGCISGMQGGSRAAYWSLASLLAAVAAAAGFAVHIGRTHYALISRAVFASRSFNMGALVSFMQGFGMYGSTYIIPVFLQSVLGLSATEAGGALVPGGLALALVLPAAGLLADRVKPRYLVGAGLLVFGGSFVALWQVSHAISYMSFIVVTLVGRIGQGFIIASLNQASLREQPPALLGQSAMVISYVRQLGGVLGVAVVAVYVDWRAAMLGVPHVSGQAFSEGFLLVGLALLVAALAAREMRDAK